MAQQHDNEYTPWQQALSRAFNANIDAITVDASNIGGVFVAIGELLGEILVELRVANGHLASGSELSRSDAEEVAKG